VGRRRGRIRRCRGQIKRRCGRQLFHAVEARRDRGTGSGEGGGSGEGEELRVDLGGGCLRRLMERGK
jgi:hypothetical protein